MILLLLASLLLFFIVYFTGYASTQLINTFFSFRITINFFEIFLFGLMACFVYCNLLSFFIAIDYRVLIPLLPVSIAGLLLYKRNYHFTRQLGSTLKLLFYRTHAFITVPLACLLFIYWIIPPFNADSGEYHYIAIRWFEQYKVIPGLGNVHGRLAFNPASFILSAAFSFTNIIGQPLYPLNGVLILLFYTWFCKKIFSSGYSPAFKLGVLFCIVLLFRTTLVNTSSPSSDLLAALLLFYIGFRTYELIKQKKNTFSDYLPVTLFTFFSITAKLSAVPFLLLLPFLLFMIANKKNLLTNILKTGVPVLLLLLPWLGRNMILSGYLLYPVPGTNLVHFDWTVPKNVVQLDYIFSRYGPREKNPDFMALQKMSLYQLTVVLFKFMYSSMRTGLVIVCFSFCSVCTWLLLLIKKVKIQVPVFLLWCIFYTCLWIWLINSPELRFGLPYVVLSAAIPFFEISRMLTFSQKLIVPVFAAAMIICAGWYFSSAVHKGQFNRYNLADFWWKPARDDRYFEKNELASYPATSLGHGVTLYYPDSTHDCLNAPGPCMNWKYGIIEMRGSSPADGFRNTKDEVQKFFPFVNSSR